MKDLIRRLTNTFPQATLFHLSVLIFRVAISLELMLAHGMKKLGIGSIRQSTGPPYAA
ncbi:putative oxidoreductase [Chitinophaga sp. CF418]|nr:putative oxidoreductase [Chitinophaga sp. CF418]